MKQGECSFVRVRLPRTIDEMRPLKMNPERSVEAP